MTILIPNLTLLAVIAALVIGVLWLGQVWRK